MLLLSVIGWSTYAQFANDWIDPNQRYFRIPITDEGIHSITQQELAAAGIPLSTPPNRFQVFRKGEELAIRVVSQNNIVSRIEFFGRGNDGTGDAALYRTPEAQAHQFYNLYTDTAAYFLTWKIANENGKRMQTDASLTPAPVVPFHLEEILIVETDNYVLGDGYGPTRELSSALYDLGEGYSGVTRNKNGVFTYTLNISNPNVNTNKLPNLEVMLQGRNNLNHRSVVSIGPLGTQLRVLDTLDGFSGFSNRVFNQGLLWSDFANGQCVIQIRVIGFENEADRQSVSFLKLTYPQNFNLGATENKRYQLEPSSADRLYVRIPTNNRSVRIFDISDENNPLIRQTDALIENGAVYFSINDNPSVSKQILAVSNVINVTNIKEAIKAPIDPSGADYLIISHNRLMTPASDGIDPVAAYVEYREQDFDVKLAEINDIYNQFNYGDPSPLAIKNYLKYALSVTEVKNLLLIGKGLILRKNLNSSDITSFFREPLYVDGTPKPFFIPTYGTPGSDMLFSVGITDPVVPAVPTGRINARNSEDVKNYLDKVKQMESTPYNALWRKDLLQLSGGQSRLELQLFAAYINGFKNIAEDDYLGGRATNKGKSSVDIIELGTKDQINEGVNLITFFGHSTSFTADIDIGDVSEHANSGRYPVLFVNGCNGGSVFERLVSFGEDWMMKENQKGAIGVIAHSDLAISRGLRRFTNLFYQFAFGTEETFGMSLGEILELTHQEYFMRYEIDDESLSQVYGMLLQGDPAYKIFGGNAPDYHITNDGITASPINEERILSGSSAFNLNLIVSNFGRSVDDSLEVKVDRILADGTTVSMLQSFERPLYKDTIVFTVENDPLLNNEGQNTFIVTLDPENAISELNEGNNFGNIELFLPKGNTINLYPIEYATVTNPMVSFIWQAADPLSDRRQYSFELDTTSTYSSPFLLEDQLAGELLLTKQIDLSQVPDSTTFYWRTRFAAPAAGEDTSWVAASFTLIRTPGQEGWGQFTTSQIIENEIRGIAYDDKTNRFEFLRATNQVTISNHGLNNINGFDRNDFEVIINDVNLLQNNSINDPFCILNTFNVIVFDKETAVPTRPFGFEGNDLLNPIVCGLTPQIIHNFTRNQILGPDRWLDSLISIMDVGSSILLFSLDSVAYTEWDDQLKSSLAQVGIRTSTLNDLVDGQPAIFLGKKGFSAGEAIEIVNNGSGLPVEEQALTLNEEIEGVFTSATINAGKIGPAKAWNSISIDYTDSGDDDQVIVSLIGTRSNGLEEDLFGESLNGTVDLSFIDATQFPTIQLSLILEDNSDQRPSILESWSIQYEQPPEGILIPDDKARLEIQEGETFAKRFKFLNISNVDFTDSLEATFTALNLANNTTTSYSKKVSAPLALDTVLLLAAFESIGKVGNNNIAAKVTSSETEVYTNNNSINLVNAVNVNADAANPVLDVTFDGVYILEGDIVSPRPRILIKLRDENPFLFKQDTVGLSLELKSPCEGCDFERITLSSANVNYVEASEERDFEVEYLPELLEDGRYFLRVQGADETGNLSGTQPYEISFEVVNESSITHFYPYPNPFSTSSRFVFTLTGDKIPDQIKVQIMTISGRVVREITDLGPMKIGNNLSEYAWDGRDEFGDQLANGVYLYKVIIRQDGEPLKHRTTSADRAFKNGFGKIYILR